MPSSHLILCRPLLLLPPIPPSIRVFSNESALRMRWPKYCSFSFSISPSNGYSVLISFWMDWWVSLQSKGLSRVFSSTTVQNFSGWTLTSSYPTELTLCHPYIGNIAFHQKSQIGGLWVVEGSYSFGLTSMYWMRDVKK